MIPSSKDKKRKQFTQSTILEYLNAKCKDCDTTKNLEAHHENGDRSDVSLKNLVILCTNCHRKREGTDKKKKDLR